MKTGSSRLWVHLITMSGWVLVLPASASARTITVDGADDWSAAEPAAAPPVLDNVGHIGRSFDYEGEYIWKDLAGDERTDLAAPDLRADIREFRITGDSGYLYFHCRMSDITAVSGAGAPQIQIAIDRDRLPGSGTEDLGGAADTKVSLAAPWERLVITRFGSGAGDVTLLDAGFTNGRAAGAEALSATSDIIEIAVPWSELGLAGPPLTPLRFTVASFAPQPDDNTQDIGGPGVSNALDCVTNYGDPGTLANTFIEVGDGRIDYFFDVHFEADGDVVSPLLVSEVLPVPSAAQGVDPTGEFIELYNASPAPLDLAGVKISDEETTGGIEGAAAFPTSHVLPPGGVVTVARSGSVFTSVWGFAPDYELISTTGVIADMTSYTLWSGGVLNINLSSSGDEVLILDASDTVLDVMTYAQFGTWPGVIGTGTTNSFTVGASISRFGSVFDACSLEDTNIWNVDAYQSLMPTPGAVARTVSQIFAFATQSGGAPIAWDQAQVPSRARLIGNGVSLNGAAFSAGLPSAATSDVGFPDEAAGAHTSAFNTALTLGRRTTLAITPGTSRAVNLPDGDDGAAARHGIELTWPCGRSLINQAGPDLVVYESGGLPGIEGAEALMISVRDASSQAWTDWYFFGAVSFQNYVGDAAAGAYATVYDLSSLGLGPTNSIDAIRLANMMPADRIAGAGSGLAQGRVLPQDGGATSDLRPDPGPMGIPDAGNGGSFGLTAFDPDPLLAAPLSAVAVIPEIIAWRSVRTHGPAGPQAILIDPAASGNGIAGPTCESRAGGIQRIEVEFDAPASVASSGLVTVSGRTTVGGVLDPPVAYVPSSIMMAGPTTLAIEFAVAPAPGFLPDETCYEITIPSAVTDPPLAADASVSVRALMADTTGSGDVTLSDAIVTQVRAGAALSGDARFDIDLSGTIDGADVLLAKSRVTSPARQSLCP